MEYIKATNVREILRTATIELLKEKPDDVCSFLSSHFKSRSMMKVADCPPDAAKSPEAEDASWYKQRRERLGMWFIAHRSTFDELRDSLDLQEDPINIWDEFFSRHPVGDEYCKNFVALQLSEESLYRNRDRIRCASYRWEDVKGVGTEYQAPSNYIWFLKWIEKNNVLGWMDFCANAVVAVDGRHTVSYMGSLYADFITASHWMKDSMKLGKALTRGWIFQETAFGSFDSAGIATVLDDIRRIGLSTLASSASASSLSLEQRIDICVGFCEKAVHFSKLLDRRGYYALAQVDDVLCDRQYEYYGQLGHLNGYADNVAELLVLRVFGDDVYDENLEEKKNGVLSKMTQIVKSGESVGYTAMFHLCEIFTDSEESPFRSTYQFMQKLLTEKTWEQASSLDEFFEKIGDPLLAAYSSLEVSYETDREDAVSRVALSIIKNHYEEEFDYNKFSKHIWEGAARICLKTEGEIGTTVLHFQPSIPEGKRFIGGISVSGARLLGGGHYMARDEGLVECYWAETFVSGYGMEFSWQESTSTWVLPCDDDNDSKQEQYDLFICSPPEGSGFFCGWVARLASGDRRPTHAQFFTAQNPPDFPEPIEECVFS